MCIQINPDKPRSSRSPCGYIAGTSAGWCGYIRGMLTDVAIKRIKPLDRPQKIADGQGLFLFVTPAGGKIWRFRYRVAGKEQLMVIGRYPQVSLAEARAARDRARENLSQGLPADHAPADARKASSDVPTFETVALDWFAIQSPMWAPNHAKRVREMMQNDILPALGGMPVSAVKVVDVLPVLRAIEDRGALDAAKRARQRISAIFGHAIASGLAENDPAANVGKALRPIIKGRQPAVTDIEKARQIIRDVDAAPGHAYIKLALRLLALTALRPGTLITTPWSELDGGAVWHVPPARMKLVRALKGDATRAHTVMLSTQAQDTVAALRLLTGSGPYVFPNGRSALRHASENAMGYMLNRAGYHQRHVPHGWRATFSTIMNELRPADRAVIDLMLAHTPKDKVEAAYNRSEHMARRMEIAQEWSDLLMVDQIPAAEIAMLPVRL